MRVVPDLWLIYKCSDNCERPCLCLSFCPVTCTSSYYRSCVFLIIYLSCLILGVFCSFTSSVSSLLQCLGLLFCVCAHAEQPVQLAVLLSDVKPGGGLLEAGLWRVEWPPAGLNVWTLQRTNWEAAFLSFKVFLLMLFFSAVFQEVWLLVSSFVFCLFYLFKDKNKEINFYFYLLYFTFSNSHIWSFYLYIFFFVQLFVNSFLICFN